MERMPTYEQLYASFRWNIPARYNIAADVCDRHAADPEQSCADWRSGRTARLANDFSRRSAQGQPARQFFAPTGLVKGDRVMLLLGQNPWTAIGHVAVLESRAGIGAGVDVIRRRRCRLRSAQCLSARE